MQVSYAAGRVTAEVFGDGTPLVLMHSLLSDRGSFDRVAPALAMEHRVILPDLPGFGGSSPAPGGLEAVADRMAEALGEAFEGEPGLVLGNGYGGFVALQMVIRHPGLAQRLILADSGAAFPEPGRAAFRTMAAVASAKGLGAIADTAMRRLFAPAFQAAMPDLMAERRAAFLRTDLEAFVTACEALATLDLRDALSKVAIPVLVMVGEDDVATPPAMARDLAAGLPGAALVILPDCAHVPQLQDPDRFLAALRPFLQRSTV